MGRREDNRDTPLMYLGATYYQTLRGETAARDVAGRPSP